MIKEEKYKNMDEIKLALAIRQVEKSDYEFSSVD